VVRRAYSPGVVAVGAALDDKVVEGCEEVEYVTTVEVDDCGVVSCRVGRRGCAGIRNSWDTGCEYD